MSNERNNMGFKKYVKTVTPEEAKKLIREGAELYGSIRQLTFRLTFSPTHIYRWSNAESAMSLKDYNDIKAIIKRDRTNKGKIA